MCCILQVYYIRNNTGVELPSEKLLSLVQKMNLLRDMAKSTLRAVPPFVFFFTEEEKSRLCPNRVNSLKPPQPELLD